MAKPRREKKSKTAKVEPMPSLIFHEATLSDAKLDIKPTPIKTAKRATYQTGASRIMWTGVITICAIIAGFWGYSLRLQISNIIWSNSTEAQLAKNTKTNWDQVFAEQKKNLAEQKNNLETVRTTLINVVSQQTVASSTTSTILTTSTLATTTLLSTSTSTVSVSTTTSSLH